MAVVGYLAAMLINPNNHALDGGPSTAAMEKECVERLAAMFGMNQHLGHLTSSGTIANLEALWVGREEKPGSVIAVSRDAHYTHARMGNVLGVEVIDVDVDDAGRMAVDDLARVLETHNVGTVVVTLGTTGIGAIDPSTTSSPWPEPPALGCTSMVPMAASSRWWPMTRTMVSPRATSLQSHELIRWSVDPHKHGLQPYGCGAVLFADPGVGTHYAHESPYTYFSSDELHLGEISLECSRAGAAAAAFWLTTEVFPLTSDGLGRILRTGLRGARRMHSLLQASSDVQSLQEPGTRHRWIPHPRWYGIEGRP